MRLLDVIHGARRIRGRIATLLGAATMLGPLPPAVADEAASADPLPDALVGTIPLEDVQGEINRMIVNVAPEGHRPFRLWLDTGATDSVLTPRAARANGVSVRRTKSSPYIKPTRLGEPLRFYVDTTSSDTAAKTFEAAVLGGRFLSLFVVEFDFDDRVVRFYDPDAYSVPESVSAPDEAVVPIGLTNNRPFVEVDLGGKRPLQVLMDTGAPGSLLVSGRSLKKVGIDTSDLPSYGSGTFWLGTTELRFKERQALRLGPFDLGDVPMEVAPRGTFNLGGNTGSLIGFDVISQFKMRIDYENQRLWLKRRENVPLTYMGTDIALGQKAGAYLGHWTGAYQVAYVRPGSPAEAYGLRTGDYFDLHAVQDQNLDAEKIARAIETGATLFGSRPRGRTAEEVEFPGGRSAIPDQSEFMDE